MENIKTSNKEICLLDCKVGDKVYLYKKNLFKNKLDIDKNMIGEVISLEQEIFEGYAYIPYLYYIMIVKMNDGKHIRLEKNTFWGTYKINKYRFITLKEIKQILVVIQTGLEK